VSNYLLTMPPSQYYSDECSAQPSLSQSIAHTLLSRSPYHAWLAHPKLGNGKEQATKAMEDGTILHSMLLGTTANVEWLDFDNYRTKAAQEARDLARHNSLIPLLKKERMGFERIIRRVNDQLFDCGITLTGQAEGVVQWIERDNQNRAVYCKAMVDSFDGANIYDLKFVADAHPKACLSAIINNGYDIQAAVYLDAISKQHPALAGRLSFRNIFCEKEAPHLVTVVEQSGELLTLGRTKWARAINLWSECLHNNRWPAYGQVRLSPPAWAISQEMEAA